MFGHDDDQNQPQNNVADPMQDDSLVTDSTPGVTPGIASDTAGDYVAEPVAPTTMQPEPTSVLPASAPLTPSVATDDLLAIKQQALQQLSPLMTHLEQTPEEKFRTTMMMIQAADNQALIRDAYDAAQAIPDEKTRAQALLDVINEINYFTQQHEA